MYINNDNEIKATQSFCPHVGGHFFGGWCKTAQLLCPVHQYGYDLKAGRGAEGQRDCIDIYPTEVREDGLYIGFEKRW